MKPVKKRAISAFHQKSLPKKRRSSLEETHELGIDFSLSLTWLRASNSNQRCEGLSIYSIYLSAEKALAATGDFKPCSEIKVQVRYVVESSNRWHGTSAGCRAHVSVPITSYFQSECQRKVGKMGRIPWYCKTGLTRNHLHHTKDQM